MMIKHWRATVLAAALGGLLLSVQPLAAQSGDNSYNDHWLAAACPESSPSGHPGYHVVTTDFGVAVEHGGRVTGPVVFRCNITADDYYNWLQFYAKDNSPTASVTVSVFRQDVVTGGAPELLYTLTSSDQPGVLRAELFLEDDFEPNELTYLYYLELTLDRATTRDRVRLYSVSLRDVL
jgi:hypothetical protein